MKITRNKTHLFVIIWSFLPLLSWGQQKTLLSESRFQEIEVFHNPVYRLQFMDELPLWFRVKIRNKKGTKTKVRVFKGQSWAKRNLILNTSNAQFKNGSILYDTDHIHQTGGSIKIKLRDKKAGDFERNVEIPVPNLQDIILGYDSSQVGPEIPIQLKVDLKYSDGYIAHIGDPWYVSFSIRANRYPDKRDFNFVSKERIVSDESNFYLIPSMNSPSLMDLKMEYRRNPDVSSKLAIPLTFNASYQFNYRGRTREFRSKHAPSVQVYLKKIVREGVDLLWVKTQSGNIIHQALINPVLAHVSIDCRGGRGMDGTNGSDGSDGCDDPPTDGEDGDNGEDGEDGGNGGSVYIYTDSESASYIQSLLIYNEGGAGGDGGSGGDGGDGADGKCDGSDGSSGDDGRRGQNGPAVQVIYLPSSSLENMLSARMR